MYIYWTDELIHLCHMLLSSTDPDNVEPFPVHCEMMEYPPIGISVVGHDQENEVSYHSYSPLKC